MNANNINNLFPTSEPSTVYYTGYTANQEQAYTQFTGPNMASTLSFPAPGYPLYFPGYDASGNIDMSVAGPVNHFTPVYQGHLGYVASEVPTGFFSAPTAQPADLYSNYPMADPANMDPFNVAPTTPFNPLGYSPYPDPAGSPVYESDPWDTSESTFFTGSDSDPQDEPGYLEAPYVPTRDDVIWYCGGDSAETGDPIAWEAYQSGRSLVDVQFNPAEHQISRYSELTAAIPWRMGEFYEGPVSTPIPTPSSGLSLGLGVEDVVMREGEVEGGVVASGADASAGASGSGSGSAMRTRSGVRGPAQKIDRKGKKTPRMIREAEMAAAAAAAKESVKADSRKGKRTGRMVKAEIVATSMDVSSASPSSRSRGRRQSTASTARLSRSGRSPEKSPRKARAVGAEFGDQEYEQDVLREVESIEPKATRSGRRFVGAVVEEEKERIPANSPRKARGVRAEFGYEEFEVDMLREAEGIEPKVTRSGRRRCINIKDEEADVDEVVAMLTGL